MTASEDPRPRRLTMLSSISAALGGLLAGAIVGAAAEDLAGGSLGIASTTAVAAALAIAAFAVVMQLLVSAFGQQAGSIEQIVDRHGAAVNDATERVRKDLVDLRHQIVQTVHYQTVKDLGEQYPSTFDDPVTKACLAAEREILVLDLIDDSGDHPASVIDEPLLEGFLEALIGRVSRDRDLFYHRIVQLNRPEALASASPVFEAHCAAMRDLHAGGRSNVVLETADVRYPFKFILVDRTRLMLQLNAVNRTSHQRLEAWCEFLFTQAHPELVRGFTRMWEDVAYDARTRPVAD